MTNRQWLMEQIQNMSDEDFAELIHVPPKMDEEVCDTLGDCFPRECNDCKLYWLQAEHKEPIKLSDAERVILENIDKDYKWIFRSISGDLWLTYSKPFKDIKDWHCGNEFIVARLTLFKHLFKFIKHDGSEPYNIEELLKGE
ncbi:MAG: hypothetical protein IJX99_01115 [Clostridia bacterium]|nr:hypothetical protein [Clostridia bacterium]MBQ8298471.1 hypothetical protein [Clostridia bacterium]